ncbi:hypothetical protein E2C01_000600 [Portunus trituberculatus]|uniref:Uncharacterized protein n=1 Tax=Portunus trituberculatus TaxID=210409 RepID=A0A5B7CFJ1_PORTR|nr:hypothetical protein [Portunus trituberculatus]
MWRFPDDECIAMITKYILFQLPLSVFNDIQDVLYNLKFVITNFLGGNQLVLDLNHHPLEGNGVQLTLQLTSQTLHVLQEC